MIRFIGFSRAYIACFFYLFFVLHQLRMRRRRGWKNGLRAPPREMDNNYMLLKLIKLMVGLLSVVVSCCLPTAADADVPSSLEYGSSRREGCDIFRGDWIPDPLGPPYTNASCKFIHARQNCIKNGRPDTGYIHWRWKPYGCDLPHFDPKKFLNFMRDRSWAMIGDSLLRNQMQSMLCLLTEVEQPVDISRDEGYKSRTWYFRSHNFTIATYWAPFLLKADFLTKIKVNLHLDELETKWMEGYHEHDYVVVAAGSWFGLSMIMTENNTVVGCHACRGEYEELGMFYPYRRALQQAFDFIAESDHKPVVIFRTWSPNHFKYGEWFDGGVCNRTAPYSEGEYGGTPIDHRNYAINMEEFGKAAAIGSGEGIRMKLLDIHHLSLLRPDGHPGPYMKFYPLDHEDENAKVQNDCLHWCLPGPIDTWNDLMMEMLIKEEDTSLKNIS